MVSPHPVRLQARAVGAERGDEASSARGACAMILFLAATLLLVLIGLWGSIGWVALVGTVLLVLAYALALAEGRRR